MKNYSINKKTIDFFKKNGKNIVCSTLAAIALMIPCKAKLESNNQEVINSTKIEEMVNNQELVFIVKSEWQKTDNYSDGNGPAKENREYQRIVRRFMVTENYNENYFKENYQKVLETIRDNKYLDNILKLISEDKEVIVVNQSEENKLDKKNWTIEVEGTNNKATIINPEYAARIRSDLGLIGFLGITFVGIPMAAWLLHAIWVLTSEEINKVKNIISANKTKEKMIRK